MNGSATVGGGTAVREDASGALLGRLAELRERVAGLVERRSADDPTAADPLRGLYVTPETARRLAAQPPERGTGEAPEDEAPPGEVTEGGQRIDPWRSPGGSGCPPSICPSSWPRWPPTWTGASSRSTATSTTMSGAAAPPSPWRWSWPAPARTSPRRAPASTPPRRCAPVGCSSSRRRTGRCPAARCGCRSGWWPICWGTADSIPNCAVATWSCCSRGRGTESAKTATGGRSSGGWPPWWASGRSPYICGSAGPGPRPGRWPTWCGGRPARAAVSAGG